MRGFEGIARSFWDIAYGDPRVRGRVLNVPFPEEVRQKAPVGSGVLILIGDQLERLVLPTHDLSSWIAQHVLRISQPGRPQAFRLRDPRLPAHGTAHFLVTRTFEDAHVIARELEGNLTLSF
mgnify:CR=1 FL=1